MLPDPCLHSCSNSPQRLRIDGYAGGSSMGQPTVILIGADKGGVGKTTVARTLLDYFSAHEVPARAFDTEAPKGTLQHFHPEISEIVDVTSISGQMRIFDTVSDSTVTVVDVRAGLLSPTLHALRDIEFLGSVKQGDSPSSCCTSSVLLSPRWRESRTLYPPQRVANIFW
jgi:hypothetical protein